MAKKTKSETPAEESSAVGSRQEAAAETSAVAGAPAGSSAEGPPTTENEAAVGGDLQSPNLPIQNLQISVPPGDAHRPGYALRHLELQLSTQQAAGLRALYDGLDQCGSRLANGRRVHHITDAVRWLCEQLTPGE